MNATLLFVIFCQGLFPVSSDPAKVLRKLTLSQQVACITELEACHKSGVSEIECIKNVKLK